MEAPRWRYLVITTWGDISGTNSQADMDIALLHWEGSVGVDCLSGAVVGVPEGIEELDVVRYRTLQKRT